MLYAIPRLIGSLALSLCAVLLFFTTSGQAFPQGPKGKGKGGADKEFLADRDTFHYLLMHREDIRRTVKRLPDGVETLTESDVASVTSKIQEHAIAMHRRVKEGRPIHMRDPLFRALFRNYQKIEMKVEKTAKGVRVKETSKDRHVAAMIQAHADVVSKFIANGHDEVRKNHDVPDPLPPAKK